MSEGILDSNLRLAAFAVSVRLDVGLGLCHILNYLELILFMKLYVDRIGAAW